MKFNKTITTFIILSLFTLMLCSCSTDSIRTGTKDAAKGIRNAARQGENVIDKGVGMVESGIDSMLEPNNSYSANGGFSGYSANGTGTTLPYSPSVSEIMPTAGSKAKINRGQINTTNGSSDGGKGDIFKDTSMKRNSLSQDK